MSAIPTCVFNEYCGHGAILRAACGVQGFVPIRGRIQHGWSPVAGGMALDRLTDAGEPLFFWTERARAEFLAEHPGYPRSFAIGAPFLYMPGLAAAPAHDRTLLAFPFHGTIANPLADGAWGAYVAGLTVLARQLGTTAVTVCLYDLEWREGPARPAVEAAGFVATTLGPPLQAGYLARFHDLVSAAAAVVASRPCTALFYVMAMGRPVMVKPDGLRFADPDRHESITADEAWCHSRFLSLYREEPVQDDAVQRQELGTDCVLPSARLFDVLYGWTQVG